MERRLRNIAEVISKEAHKICEELVRLDKAGKKISRKKIWKARVLVKLYLYITTMY